MGEGDSEGKQQKQTGMLGTAQHGCVNGQVWGTGDGECDVADECRNGDSCRQSSAQEEQ